MSSILAIINARRLWCGGPTHGEKSNCRPEVNAMLIVDGIIRCIGDTKEVMAQYTVAVQKKPSTLTVTCTGGRPRPASARIIDCQGRHFVGPGFVDSHVHFLDGGRKLSSPCLDFAQSKSQFISIVREYYHQKYVVEGRDANTWIFGSGWSETVLGCAPSRYWLDEVSSTVPIVIYSKDVHSAVYNTAALRRCRIIPEDEKSPIVMQEVDGGVIEWDPVRLEPTGVLRDNAVSATRKYRPSRDSEDGMVEALELASQYLLERGFTMVFSMTSLRFDNMSEIEFLERMQKAGKLRLRVRSAVRPFEADRLMSEFYNPILAEQRHDGLAFPFCFSPLPAESGGGYLLLGAVKFFSDGSLSSRTAAMTHPYEMEVTSDDGEAYEVHKWKECCNCGFLTMTREELTEAIAVAQKHHLQCCGHAIGDRAVSTVNTFFADTVAKQQDATTGNQVLNQVMRSFQQNPRYRVEHCQHVSSITKECDRMSKHGIIASMQPCHLLFDGDYADHLLGKSRKKRSYVWKSFLKKGVHVAFGSDWMVAPADIMDGLRGSVLRTPDMMTAMATEKNAGDVSAALHENEKPTYHSVWNASECLTMEEALRAYTYEGAYAAFMDQYVGSLEVGKWADVTVFSDDLLDESHMESSPMAGGKPWWIRGREPQVLYTIVGGNVEYERPSVE